MLLQILQLLVMSYIVSHGEGRNVETRSKYGSIIHQQHLRKEKDGTPSLVGPDKTEEKDGANNPEKNRVPKSKPQQKDKPGEKKFQAMNLPRMAGNGGTRSNRFSERRADVSGKNYAQVSFNHFMYKMNAASEAFKYPVKTEEVQREVCKTLPFTQVRE